MMERGRVCNQTKAHPLREPLKSLAMIASLVFYIVSMRLNVIDVLVGRYLAIELL